MAGIKRDTRIDPLAKLKEKLQNRNLKFSLTRVSEKEVLKVLKDLKNKTSSGPDGISSELLKYGAEVLAAPLCWIINHSIETGQFPTQWKSAKVVPLFKNKGSRQDLSKYRPVSLLSTSGMVLEKIVKDQIERHFEENNLFGTFQFGFRKSKSTISELLTLFQTLLDAKDENKEILLVLYDLSSAFDTVSHDTLLAKLKLYGFDDLAVKWMESYLRQRKQSVCVSGKISEEIEITQGTPQGSRLSPLLFICLMADMDLWCEGAQLSNFADDTQSVHISDNKDTAIEKMKEEANGIIEFFTANDLVNNADKAALIYNSKGTGKRIEIEDIGGEVLTSLSGKETEKLLGLHINANLDWKQHVDKISAELMKRLGLLKRIKKRVPISSLLIIAEAIFNAKIRYGISVYLKPTFEKEDVKTEKLTEEMRQLQTQQNHMLRMVFGHSINDHVNMKKLREKIKMFSVNQMAIYHGGL